MNCAALKLEGMAKVADMVQAGGNEKPAFKEVEYFKSCSKKLYMIASMVLQKAIELDCRFSYYIILGRAYSKLEKTPKVLEDDLKF
jgi:hypothetical protein